MPPMPRTCDTSACGLGPDEWSKSDRLKSDRFLEELKKDPAFEWSKFDRFLVELEKDPLEEGGGLAGGAFNDATRDDEEARNDLSAKSKAETRDRLRTAQRPAPDCHHCHKQHHPAFG